jgi:uncharacterized protein YecA (UPF0149 family)
MTNSGEFDLDGGDGREITVGDVMNSLMKQQAAVSAQPASSVPQSPLAAALMPKISARPVAGRNDPCPCGSGKKFKKCCGRNVL